MNPTLSPNATQALHDVISKQLSKSDLDIVGILPIPNHSDRMIRLQTLQEMLEDSEESINKDSVHYLIQLKPKRAPAAKSEIEVQLSQPTVSDNIYLSNGKLNILYLFKNADILYDSGDYPLAKNIYKTILKSGENPSLALHRLGCCLQAEGKNDEAASHFEESIAYNPTLESFQKLSALLLAQSKDKEAAEVMERAINLKNIDRNTKFELYKAAGNCWTRSKQTEKAEHCFKRALEINPSADDIRGNIGALYLQNNKIPEAKRYFRDAIASNSRNHLAMAGLGSCCLAEGDKKAAHDHFLEALNIELNNPNAIFYLVKCAYELKSYAAAAKMLEEYIQIAPVNPNLLYSLAGLQFHLGRISDSKKVTEKILQLQPHHSGAKELLTIINRYAGSTG